MVCNRKIEELNSQELKEIEVLMNNKEFSCAKFIGDNEKLMDVYEKDLQTLKQYDIDCKQIADRLDTIIGKFLRYLFLLN